ncbi:FAD-dependent oxidoreductase [Rufibacter glacialis]|uniref:Kynurenine 3-monooxygenase n=1 Tax=Rufibacter glacialis TaxID=1259555 RepID=A0A5M8QED7_9BACT|nr:NAD(P)/FAD-dependent oxidoreductase [Rufibacter glacialis]KAA6433290.1 FAD-dependent monooxygenase [Rufibacter glacialis]GGK75736.1 kynurenine 3-monooxygenase [Rufibacter glacialis]
MEKTSHLSVMGGGLVGCLLSLYLSKQGYKVDVYERRPDLRRHDIGGGRSINLALSDRGWRALETIGISEEIKKVAIPLYRRVMHDKNGNLSFQPYGQEGQAIYSVSRGGLNEVLLDLAEAQPSISLHFQQQVLEVEVNSNKVTLLDTNTQQEHQIQPDVIFAADGAFSMVRLSLQKTERFNYEQSYLDYGYKELTIPPAADGGWQLEKNALHIWPRGQYMMIALPNMDGSFTCTMFFPYAGNPSFESLQTAEDLERFFGEVFPDAAALMPDLAQEFFENPIGTLVTIKCFPWSHAGKILLVGDAAHAIVPFYGQGMNAGFEDCTVLRNLLEQHQDDWETIFKTFQDVRKPNTDAIADLAVYNFIEMRDKVADPRFLLQKKVEAKITAQYPDSWLPLYSMVTFSPDLPYAEALANGQRQEKIMNALMAHIETEEDYDKPEVQQYLQAHLT